MLGYGSIITQAEDTTPAIAAELKLQCAAQGLACGVWETAPDYGSMLRRATEGWQFIVEQIEGAGQYDRVLQSVGAFRDSYPNLPAAIITNFGGLTPDNCKPLITANIQCLVECFIGENKMSTPANQIDYATRVLGWKFAQPMIGLGSGLTLANYPGYEKYWGYSVWSAEYIL